MAKKNNKKYSSSSSRKGKIAKVTRKPQRASGYKKPAVKRKVSLSRPSSGKKPSQNTTARAILKEFQKLQQQPSPTKKIGQRTVKKPAKRASYKGKAQDNLSKILQNLQKEVKSLKEEVRGGPPKKDAGIGQTRPKKEAFPEEEDVIAMPTTQQEALILIAEIRNEMNQRTIMLDEMMNQSGKLYFND